MTPFPQQLGSSFLLALILSYVKLNKGESTPAPSHDAVHVQGEIILGGLFPMHEHNVAHKDYPCGAIKEEKGIQRMEAMLYALDEINRDKILLPDIELGALILDTCSNPSTALEQSMQFVRSLMDEEINACQDGDEGELSKLYPVTGVIGAAFSGVSIMVANILRLFQIPQISYASTSTELSDKTRFEYFSRVVPPDNFQAQAMVEISKMMKWSYVSTVAAEGEYGEKGIASFIALAKKDGICVAVSTKISRNAKDEEFDRIVDILSSKPMARAVVLFVDEDRTRKLLSATVRRGKTEWAAEGAITILPKRSSLKGFDEYFLSLRPPLTEDECKTSSESSLTSWFSSPKETETNRLTNCRNPWFREFWSHHFRCSFPDQPRSPDRSVCTGNEKLSNHEQEGLVPFVVDATYAMANALHTMIVDTCGNSTLCPEVLPSPPGAELLKYIRNVSFTSIQGDQIGDVKFNKDGDRIGRYSIFQYQRVKGGSGGYKYGQGVLRKSWKQELALEIYRMYWPNVTKHHSPPKSVCSSPCMEGHVKSFYDSVRLEEDQCYQCPTGYVPNLLKNQCLKLDAEILHWDSPWAFFPILFSSLGIAITLEVVVVFMVYNRTSVIMASGRELSYVLLGGILASYTMTFVILAEPTVFNCTILRLGLGLFGVSVWILLEQPGVKDIYPSREVAMRTCAISTFSLVMSLSYNMRTLMKPNILDSQCTPPVSFGFLFIPIFFGTKNDYEIQISSLCMCVILSATVTLCCLFMPKMYIVLLHPEKYARATPGSKQSTQHSTNKMRFTKSQESSLSVLSEIQTPRDVPKGGILGKSS
ncbi:GRM8 [Lepeophtheirus salmonis]|uniref:GRM8 n=1 Tax=Lepeophtheirus salmonis TaxID=72036 RepID=A0A7R8CTS3_LEPSM|nr:GRM8 [Lepeophtheirus salmonis]CAF2928878.1 GRM8 [Lepeophtheirus salmonis]